MSDNTYIICLTRSLTDPQPFELIQKQDLSNANKICPTLTRFVMPDLLNQILLRNCVNRSPFFPDPSLFYHRRMTRGGHGLPKVSPRPAMPYTFTLCGQATPEMTLRPFERWPAHRATGLGPSSTPMETPRRTPMCFSLS
jgi:hypothetical protein